MEQESRGRGPVHYGDFGAAGDGKADDGPALRRAHGYANGEGLPVAAEPRQTYYLAPSPEPIPVLGPADWRGAAFILDDQDLAPADRVRPVFHIKSAREPLKLELPSLKKNQGRIEAELPANSLVLVVNENFRQFRRVGLNVSAGSPQTDCFIVDQSGAILNPPQWDFGEISSALAYPMDEGTLRIRGGRFTTIANRAPREYTYYERGLKITRSNVLVEGLVHLIQGEGPEGAPYGGFISADTCARLRVRDCHFSPHFIYTTIGAAGLPVAMGSYDITLNRCVDILFQNCRQNRIMDRRYWGLFGSNFCRDLRVEGCVISRVDAHQGVRGYTIRDSTIGYMGLKATGGGLMRVEGVSLCGGDSIDLREDYGSAWDGDLILKDITWRPGAAGACLIRAKNRGGHDFGYPCRLPRRILIENLTVLDGELPPGEEGMASLLPAHPDTNADLKSWGEPAEGDRPYVFAELAEVRGVRTESGRGVKLFSHPPEKCYAPLPGGTGGGIRPNFQARLEDLDGLWIELPEQELEYDGTHRLLPEIRVRFCQKLRLNRGKNPGIVISGD